VHLTVENLERRFGRRIEERLDALERLLRDRHR